MIVLLLLLAAPERVTIVAKPQHHSMLDGIGAAAKRAWTRLYQKTDPDVDEGNTLAAQNDPEGALRSYDRALERMPDSAELHFDRANQMLKLGSDHAKAAHDEAMRATETDNRALKARANFDVALSEEEMGNPDEAIKAYERTLALDPDDADAKVNLELLLRQEERKKQQPQQQQDDNKQKNDKDQQQQQQQQQSQQKQDEQKKETPQEQQNQEQQQQQAKDEEKKQPKPEEKPVDRSEAERLLDATRAGEKNLQTWRFSKEKRKETHRGEVEKDW